MINTVPCTPDEAKELIKSLSSLKLSFMLWGATGVGKSEAVRHLAAELNAELRDIRLCQKQPTDIGGLPALDHDQQQTVFYPPAFLAHVISETGTYLAPQAGVKPGAPMAYLIAPPLEATVAVDAALKAAPVTLAKWIPPPSETNFAGAFLTGDLADLNAARDAFVAAIEEVVRSPLQASRRPDRLRR